mgnify:CR=1 FL=1
MDIRVGDQSQEALLYEPHARSVIKSSPLCSSILAEAIGVHKKDLSAFLNGKSTLPKLSFKELMNLFDIELIDPEEDLYPGFYSDLVLTPTTSKIFLEAYDYLSGGGDIDIAYEPINLMENWKYRYLVIERCSSAFLFRLQSNSPICNHINANKLAGFTGSIYIKDIIFSRIERLCDFVIRSPLHHLELTKDFFRPWHEVTALDFIGDESITMVDFWKEAVLEYDDTVINLDTWADGYNCGCIAGGPIFQ